MANDPMQLLMAEHEVIRPAKDVIDSVGDLWQRDSDAYESLVRELLTFFANYSDGFHHHKEEDALFPALKNNVDFIAGGMLDELEEHHQMFREQLASVRSALEEKNYAQAQSGLERYFDALLDHIAVENDELFVMTESLFTPAELEKMYFRFKDIDRELGEERKRELEATLPRLRRG